MLVGLASRAAAADPDLQPAPVAQVCPAPAKADHDPAWTAPATIEATATAALEPRMAHLAGQTFGVRLAHDVDVASVVLAASADGGATWSPDRRVDAPADCAGLLACPIEPQVVAGGGHLYLLYGGADIGTRVRASADHGATFGPSAIGVGGTSAGAAIGGDGRVHVAGVRGGPYGVYGAADHVLEYAMSADHGARFSRPIAISGRDEQLPLVGARPAIATDGKSVYIAYVRGGRDLAWDIILAYSKDAGATWRRAAISEPSPCALRMSPALAVDARTGRLHVAWFDSRGGGRVIHATCAIGGGVRGAATCAEGGTISDGVVAFDFDHLPAATLAVDAGKHAIRAVWTRGDGLLVQSSATLPKR
jgi:hypothetical protein